MSGRETNLTKNSSPDKILVLEPKPGLDPKSGSGMVDKRLFSGANQLHAIMDPEYGHWYLKYDSGIIPQQLQQRWTSFPRLLDYTRSYFEKRDILIKEVKE